MQIKRKALGLPHIPLLDAETESVSLAELGGRSLDTRLDAPGASLGDHIHINWRGRSAIGKAEDFVQRVSVANIDDEGRVMQPIPYRILQALDGGDVFYSYALDGSGGAPGDESPRLAFRVNRPVPAGGLELGVAQARQAHDLWIAIDDLNYEPLTVVTPPFQAMAEDVVVTLNWSGYFDDGDPFEPYKQSYTLTTADVGLPVVWLIPWDQVAILEDGFADVHYSIRHANGEVSESALQRYQIASAMPPVSPLLPAPRIKGHSGGSLDPDEFPNGIEVIIPDDPGANLKTGDHLVLYIEGSDRVVYTARVDPSTLDSGYMALIETRWVHDGANFGKPFSISYQYVREGMAKHSQSLDLALRRPLLLPAPIVVESDPEGDDNQGVVYPKDIRNGFQVRIPPSAVIDGGDVKLILEGHETLEFVPSVGDERLFKVAPAAIPANLGKRVNLYYTVTPPGEWPHESDVFDLRIADYAMGSYPLIQSDQVSNGQVSFAKVSKEGILFWLGSWAFMAQGQLLSIEASYEGLVVPFPMRVPPVTEGEYREGKVEGRLTYEFLKQMREKNLERFRIQPRLSFDAGVSFKDFRYIDIKLVD